MGRTARQVYGRARASAASVARLRPGQGAPPSNEHRDRVDSALLLVARLELDEPAVPDGGTHRDFLRGERFVACPRLPAGATHMLPTPWRLSWGSEGAGHDLHRSRAAVAADAVILAKHDDPRAGLKLRSAYVDDARVVGVVPDVPGRASTALRVATSHAVVGRYAPYLIPPLLAMGDLTAGSGRYFVEGWVTGRPLMSPRRLGEAVGPLCDALTRVHAGYGTSALPLSRAPGAVTAGQWAVVRDLGLVPDAVAARVADLVERDVRVRCSWTHGDTVSSNVLSSGGEHVLVDWENAGFAPVMTDAAKLHLFAHDGPRALADLLEVFGRHRHGATCTAGEELALSHARLLAAYPARRRRLHGHPRAEAYELQVRRGALRLAEALAA
ncbi:aminoglycoside phosphotransferase family protein [Janibacter sp. Y6]|uniref:phosphotransferase n=1 Tax=Janibacter sp. Y6 TaxID=2913552 RepID=UPI0034A31784